MNARWDDFAFARAQTDAATAELYAIVHLGLNVDHLADALAHVPSGPPETRFTIGNSTVDFDAMEDGDVGVAERFSFAGFDSDGWRIHAQRAPHVAELAWGGGSAALKSLRPQIEAALARHGFEARVVKRLDLAR